MSDKTKLSDDLHDAIMRLPCNAVAVEFSSQELRAYKEGHRDACQAAAELAASHATDAPAHGEQEAKLLADQVSAWKAEIARLEGMVAYATGTPPSEQKPVAWRDALRRCGANTDYHGLIAFTGAQLEQFVGMLATPTASPVASIPIAAPHEFGSIRDLPEFREDLESLSEPGVGKKTRQAIRKEIYDTIDRRTANAIESGRRTAQAGAPVASEKRNEELHSLMLGQAVVFHKFTWPAELHSGVMFFNGQRITRAEFVARAALAKMEGV